LNIDEGKKTYRELELSSAPWAAWRRFRAAVRPPTAFDVVRGAVSGARFVTAVAKDCVRLAKVAKSSSEEHAVAITADT
jgi:hypothetical protein